MIARAFSKALQQTSQQRSSSLSNPDSWLLNLWGGQGNTAGVAVNTVTAKAQPAVFACIRLLSQTFASLPWEVVEQSGDIKRKVKDHHLAKLINVTPHPDLNKFLFWEWMMSRVYTHGVSVALIKRDGRGNAEELELIEHGDWRPIKDNGEPLYRARYFWIKGQQLPVSADDLLIIGNTEYKSPILLHAQSIGIQMAADELGAKYYKQGTHITGILSSDSSLNDSQKKSLKESWTQANNGLNNAGGTAVIPVGLKYQRLSIPPNESQFLETKKYQTQDICRMYGVPPFLIQAESDTKYSNTEQQNLHFVMHTVRPMIKRVEAEVNKKLVPYPEKDRTSARWNVDALLRGDIKTRAEYYDKMIKAGVFSINHVLSLENHNPVDGGDLRLVQMNQVPIHKAEEFAQSVIDKNQKQGNNVTSQQSTD